MKLNLGNQIRLNRLRLEMTQEQLAEKFGTSPQAVSRWENGTTYPDIEMLPMIASFFETTVDALLVCTDEEKQKFCDGLQKTLSDAIKEKDVEKTISALREIRCNLREYQNYWIWGIYWDLFKSRLYDNVQVLDEIRLLTGEILKICPRDLQFDAIEGMAFMENDEKVDDFLNAYANREGMSKSRLLLKRYRVREDLDKIEPVRQYVLWYELDNILTNENDWQTYLLKDPAQLKWFCETQLSYLNAINCLTPDKERIVGVGCKPDLWCWPRVTLGLLYTRALTWLGETDAALDAFEDTVSIVENVMSIKDDKFELGCDSPALKGFALNAEFHWMKKDGKEYRELCLEKNGWNEWIIPTDILRTVTNDVWFEPIEIDDPRFDRLIERLKNCVIEREAQE